MDHLLSKEKGKFVQYKFHETFNIKLLNRVITSITIPEEHNLTKKYLSMSV